MFDSVGGRCPVWLITDSAPECPAVCYPLTEEGRKSVPSGADLVMDVGKALSLDFGRDVLFVRNLQQSGLEVIRGGCLKEAELEVRLKGSRICNGIERRSGEGNGNPLQCSCLENPRDGGAWWAAVYGVAHSRTRLK